MPGQTELPFNLVTSLSSSLGAGPSRLWIADFNGGLVRIDMQLTSQYEPTRTLTLPGTGSAGTLLDTWRRNRGGLRVVGKARRSSPPDRRADVDCIVRRSEERSDRSDHRRNERTGPIWLRFEWQASHDHRRRQSNVDREHRRVRRSPQTLPDMAIIDYDYDLNGNLHLLTPPGRPIHTMEHSRVNLLSSYARRSSRVLERWSRATVTISIACSPR